MPTAAHKRLPRIAIIGRPNVGKSTLANRMCGSRVSIVEPTAGVTRDRVTVPAFLRASNGERWVEVVDTGGIGIVDRDDLGPQVEEQIATAIATSDVILWLVDVREGITPLDEEVARRLRGLAFPILLVVNKVEGRKLEWDVDVFRRFGVGEGPFAISAQNGEGLEPLYDRILELLPAPEADERAPEGGDLDSDAASEASRPTPVMRVAVVGQRNAGKSTFINALAREERMIVSEVPGTTRDAVDVIFERDGKSFVAIDTAGVRRKRSHQDAIDFYSDARAHKSIRRGDVIVLLFDVTQRLSSIDKDLARYALDHHKPVIIAANKWDLVEGLTPDDFREYLAQELPQLSFAPVSFLSAKEGQGVDETMKLALELHAQAQTRVSTGELNRVLAKALGARAPTRTAHAARIRYATQAGVRPPTFVLFVNDKKHFNKDYLRYLANRLREEFPLREIPVRIVLRDKDDPPREGGES
ncbi:MAG TPA: ribosome biogenesis GTPase Der [Planctomycetota bacterium]|jgi:GTP-binding protein|nr:ribosome biogenesis GTPase Der [Planctomycetota bacterium]